MFLKIVVNLPAVLICLFLVTLGFPTPGLASAALDRIEESAIQPRGGWQFNLGVGFEENRELLDDFDYDNWRISPFELRYGIYNNFEIGLSAGYSFNRERDESGIDNDGIEAVEIATKYRWSNNFYISAGARFAGDSDIFPHGNDGTDYWINFPFKTPAGPGAVVYELGYSFRDGETAGGQEYTNGWNFGIGYHFVVSPQLTLRTEIIGRERIFKDSDSLRDLVLGLDWNPHRFSSYRPQVRIGFDDGSPRYSAGIEFNYRFGDQGPEPYPVREVFDRTPIFGRTPAVDERPVVLPGREDWPGVDPPELPEDAAREVLALVEAGLEAFFEEDLARAAEKFAGAVGKDPENPDILINLATIYYYQENYRQARSLYQEILQLDPEDESARIGLGAVLYQQGNHAEAQSEFERVLESDPGNRLASQWLERIDQ